MDNSIAPIAGSTVGSPLGGLQVSTRGLHRWLRVPCSSQPCINTMRQLCITPFEREIVALPAVDVNIRISSADTVELTISKLIRNKAYFQALLIQSRGQQMVPACGQRCGSPNSTPRFDRCVRLPGFLGNSYGECVIAGKSYLCDHRHGADASPRQSVAGSAGPASPIRVDSTSPGRIGGGNGLAALPGGPRVVGVDDGNAPMVIYGHTVYGPTVYLPHGFPVPRGVTNLYDLELRLVPIELADNDDDSDVEEL